MPSEKSSFSKKNKSSDLDKDSTKEDKEIPEVPVSENSETDSVSKKSSSEKMSKGRKTEKHKEEIHEESEREESSKSKTEKKIQKGSQRGRQEGEKIKKYHGTDSLTRSALKNLCHKAGIKRINGSVYEDLRTYAGMFVDKIANNLLVIMEYSANKKITRKDLKLALTEMNIKLGAELALTGKGPSKKTKTRDSGESNTQKSEDSIKDKSVSEKGSHSENENESSKRESIKKPHRYRPGTVTLRNIRYQQKNDKIVIPYTRFRRLVLDAFRKISTTVYKFEKGVISLIQLTTENFLVKICECANLAAINAKRIAVTPDDIKLILTVRSTMIYDIKD